MKWEAARETLAIVGVVASMVFVGVEIRQNTAATRGQTRQELAALNQDWLTLLTADREFADLFDRAWAKFGDVSPAEEARVEIMMVLQFRRLANVFFQFQEGLVDESALKSYGLQRITSSTFDQPRFQAWWIERGWRDAFHPEFVEFIETRVGSAS
jgi:hypothetical protein